MKKAIMFLCAMVLLFGVVGKSHSALIDRGGGLIYDDVLDITWLQDANYAFSSGYPGCSQLYNDGRMDWDSANAWADQLVYSGYDNWRLPDAHNQDGSGPDVGYNVTGSELGHMYYNNLGGNYAAIQNGTFIDGITGETVSFQNLFTGHYWSGTEHPTDDAWFFYYQDGYQNHANKSDVYRFAWAVADGDVASIVPIPSAIWLLGSGLIGVMGLRKKLYTWRIYAKP